MPGTRVRADAVLGYLICFTTSATPAVTPRPATRTSHAADSGRIDSFLWQNGRLTNADPPWLRGPPSPDADGPNSGRGVRFAAKDSAGKEGRGARTDFKQGVGWGTRERHARRFRARTTWAAEIARRATPVDRAFTATRRCLSCQNGGGGREWEKCTYSNVLLRAQSIHRTKPGTPA